MTSSMMNGERRWSSTRRGGMTVLGKVAVPKPINLPSQRLENHGLDPNVEIVPKGTLSWGNKSSSSATSAWGSSSVSPNTDSGSGSPSHLCGRPSSGGGGTRPSTAGSERSHEPNAWGPSSRPSSASGAVTINQTSSASLRPHSAETKPNSSQLSRFAEISENSVAWNAALTTEKVGMAPCKSDGFSLTSGDFPTLGSEKECVETDAEPQDDRSGEVATRKDRTGTSAIDDPQHPTVNVEGFHSWRSDNLPHNEDGSRPNVEKWMAHPQPYPANIPPPHYDAWHGSPVSNSQGGVWYRGPPQPQAGHPYRTPVPPGSFPMEPFLYYPPQVPPGGLPNPQPMPRGTGPRGHHPKTGDIYRPPMPDPLFRPGVSIRPGFYPGPVTYEGYYRPPMSYCNSNDRDAPFMGMPAGPAGPAVYNRYLGQNSSEPVNSHGISSGYGSSGKVLVPELESGPPCDEQGPYKVLLKQPGNLNVKTEEENRVNSTSTNQLMFEKVDQPKMSTWENEWGLEHKKEAADLKRRAFGVEAFSQSSDNQEAYSSEIIKAKSHGIVGISDNSLAKLQDDAASPPEVSQSVATTTKDSSLIQRIEGLNAKARASDTRLDVEPKEKQNEIHYNKQSDLFAHETGASTVYPEKTDFNEVRDPVSSELSMTTGHRNIKSPSGTAIPRRPNRGSQGKTDHHSRGKVNLQEVDGWHKKHLMDSPGVMATANQESSFASTRDHNALGAIDNAESFAPDSHGDVPAPATLDSKHSQAQRTKMRELAKQRTKQLQEEEEERTRRQRARALAKLEELNRRTIVGEGSTQGSENASNDAIKMEHPKIGDPRIPGNMSGDQTTALVSDPHVVAHKSESITGTNKNSPISSGEILSKKPGNGHKEHVLEHNQLKHLEQELNVADVVQSKNVSDGGNSLKHKRMGNKQKQNVPSEKIFSEKPSSHASKESKSQTIAGDIDVPAEESSNISLNPVAESSLATRKKNNKNWKNKHKGEEAPAATSPPVLNEANLITEYDKLKASESVSDPSSSDPPVATNKDASQFRDQLPLFPVVETQGKGNCQWKSQHSRRTQRNSQNRSEKTHGSDSVIWAPVRSLNKNEATEEAVQKNEAEAVASSLKIDNQVQNIPKNKRAEREIYVPKPVAKEMAQQGTSYQDVLSINQTSDDVKPDSGSQSSDNTRSAGPVSDNVGFSTEHRNGDGRHHKHIKSHASWRQRGATESTNGQCLQDQAHVSNDGINFQKSSECQLPEKVGGSFKNEFATLVDEWDPPDGWNDPNYSASIAPVAAAIAKDQIVTGRGKRPQFKGHKGAGSNFDLHEKKFKSGGDNKKISTQSSAPEADQKDVLTGAKENQGVGDRSTSHWQPKARMTQTPNQRSFKPNVDAEVAQSYKSESRMPLTLQGTKTSDGFAPNQYDLPIIEEGSNIGHHETKGEKKIFSRKDRPYSPNQGPDNRVEVGPAGTDVRREPSFYHRSGDLNNRFAKGSESRRDWTSSQNHKQHYQPTSTNRDRLRQNLHYEYQPVGPNNGKSNMDRPKDSTQSSSGPRYSERGQGHSRRDGGNFYKQRSGAV